MEFKVVLERLFARASAVLIESDWNLKWDNAGVWEEKKDSINRIRLEFKVLHLLQLAVLQLVLIESDWNLKSADDMAFLDKVAVLIESDWNLKEYLLTNVQ